MRHIIQIREEKKRKEGKENKRKRANVRGLAEIVWTADPPNNCQGETKAHRGRDEGRELDQLV